MILIKQGGENGMAGIKIGDIVARKSYGYDIFFKVVDIKNNGKENVVTLKGITYRIQADSPESDLVVQPDAKVREYREKVNREAERKLRSARAYTNTRGFFPVKGFYRDTSNDISGGFKRPGKVLHFDGDSDYLKTCLNEYKKRGITAVGKHVPEKEQPAYVYKLLTENRPDILVLTGHDGVSKDAKDYSNINNYINSKYFVEAVKEARKFEPDMDSLIIFAGACQSMYDELIKAGANFASAPSRVLIHALDPVLVCEKLAFGSIERVISPIDVINNTITGAKGIGGVQTRGKFRSGYPKEQYDSGK